jgi:hypothetical protein
VFARVTVPVAVIGPPVKPVPVAIDVTVPPLDGAVFAIVKFGYVPLVEIPVPAVRLTT